MCRIQGTVAVQFPLHANPSHASVTDLVFELLRVASLVVNLQQDFLQPLLGAPHQFRGHLSFSGVGEKERETTLITHRQQNHFINCVTLYKAHLFPTI